MEEIKVIQIGIGPLGRKITQFITQREGIKMVGAVDLDPSIQGGDLGEIGDMDNLGVNISSSLSEAMEGVKSDAVILTTVSSMDGITPQIKDIVSQGLPVVSTCEELLYPWDTTPDLADEIDQAAKSSGVAVLGTGVNPGFLMDSLPAFLTGVCQDVQKVKVQRFQDAQFRRIPFQKKIGAGLDLEAFERKKQEGTLRHVGLTQSIQFIGNCLGWKLTKTEDVISPAIAEKEITTQALTIPAGHAAGVLQVGKGFIGSEEKITLLFRAAVGEPDPRDMVEILGTPNITSTIQGGVNGDIATCAITINAVKAILNAKPGLRTMADVGIVANYS
jgi:4-hydroxy-tetrahydrodipicolinate reductase